MGLISELSNLLSFLSISGFIFIFPILPKIHSTPIHYDLFSNADLSIQWGLTVYPIIHIFLLITNSIVGVKNSSAKNYGVVHFVREEQLWTQLLLIVLQVHASYVTLYGEHSWTLPWFLVPLFLFVLALHSIVFWLRGGCGGGGGKKSKNKGVDSPRSLILSLTSPEAASNMSEDDIVETTPTRRGRSAPRSPRSTTTGGRQSPRSSGGRSKSPRSASKRKT